MNKIIHFAGRDFYLVSNHLNTYPICASKNPYNYKIPAHTAYIYAAKWNKNTEDYIKINYHAIPVKEINSKNFSVLENIDPNFKKNNSSLYDRNY